MTSALESPAAVTARAPAKVNLELFVGPLREDGFHPLSTVYQAVGIHDEVTAARADEWGCTVSGRDAERISQSEGRGQVPADHRAGQHAQLTAEAADEIPDLPALMGKRPVQARRAVFARLRAGFAVALAPAEGPLGESAEAFFSCSSSRPFET